MRTLAFICLLVMTASQVLAQDSINPHTIQLPCNIVLHHTDVYYDPFAPPGPHDTRTGLCSLSYSLLDSNGLNGWPWYLPIIYDTTVTPNKFVPLRDWKPHGTPIGDTATWQRFFTARDKPDHSHSDIIAGGDTSGHDTVLISKNEDVDFRASGTIKLKNGFHVKPGAFFHAYIEPRWGSEVFHDNFDSSVIDRSKWYVANGHSPEGGGLQCDYDTDVVIVTDTGTNGAIDGKALDIMIREDTSKYSTRRLIWPTDCNDRLSPDTTVYRSVFSSAVVRTCPWPWIVRDAMTPDSIVYQHMPFGKYEVREKMPHTLHYLNNWLLGSIEPDINEYWFDGHVLKPSLHKDLRFGPFTGSFQTSGSHVYFISTDADWSLVNQPQRIFIDNFSYDVRLDIDEGHYKDTVVGNGPSCWPSSLKSSTAPVTFYYSKSSSCIADTLTWKAHPDAHGQYRILDAPYHVHGHDTLRFTKYYQPKKIILKTHNVPVKFQPFDCYWDSSLNWPDTTKGLLWLSNDSLHGSDLDSNLDAYSYEVNVPTYSGPTIPLFWNDSTGGYQYHTFAVEIVPNEMRFLYDSNVVWRYPDRLIPRENPYYDFIHDLDRTPMEFYVGESDMPDVSGVWQAYFEHAAAQTTPHYWPGFWPYKGQMAAHKLIDYVKVWDVPAGTILPNFPR